MPSCIPTAADEWIAGQEACSATSLSSVRKQIESRLLEVVRRHLPVVCDHPQELDDDRLNQVSSRVWFALEHHWKRLGESRSIRFSQLIVHAEQGELELGKQKKNLIFDVVLAQALEWKQERAAECFDRDYMPAIYRIAEETAGPRGVEAVGNFAAHLIESDPPKISKFAGRAYLNSWLKMVAVRHCQTMLRKRDFVQLQDDAVPILAVVSPNSQDDCRDLLRPVVRSALSLVTEKDRLLLKLLFLEEVKQKDVAAMLGVVSGHVTRLKQAAMNSLQSTFRFEARKRSQETGFQECIEQVLVGDDPTLKNWFAETIATAVRRPVE